MTLEIRQADPEQPLGYKSVYVNSDNPLPVVMVGGGGSGGGPVTDEDVTVGEGTLAEYIAANDAAVDAASKTATWGQVANRPSTFAPSAHTHPVSDITGLEARLTQIEADIAALSGDGA